MIFKSIIWEITVQLIQLTQTSIIIILIYCAHNCYIDLNIQICCYCSFNICICYLVQLIIIQALSLFDIY